MTNYNPDTPCALGVQWQPTRELALTMRGELEAYGFVLNSSATETIERIQLGLIGIRDPLQEAGIELEIYSLGTYPDVDISTATFRPGEDVFVDEVHGWNGASRDDVGPFYVYINEAAPVPDNYQGRAIPDRDFLFPIFGGAMEYSCRFAGLTGAYSSEMITSLTLYTLVSELVAKKLVTGATFVPYLELNGTRHMADQKTVVGERPGGWLIKSQWTYNPETGCSWKVADLEDFDDSVVGAAGSFGWVVKATGSANNLPCIFQSYLTIESLATDPRLATGCLFPSQTAPRFFGWNTVDLFQLDGTPDWPKVNGQDYLFVIRRRNGEGYGIQRVLVDDDMRLIEPDWHRRRIGLSQRTLTVLTVKDANDDTITNQVPALIMETGAGVSLDSQPYLSIDDDGGPGAPFDNDWTRVHSGQELQQEITTPGAGTEYAYFKTLVAVEDVEPADDLIVDLIAPGPVILQTITITYQDLQSPQTLFQTFETLFGPEILGAGQFILHFHSAGSTPGEGWRVQVVSTLLQSELGGPVAGSEEATFNSDVDALTVGATRYVELDAVASIHTIPDPPEDFAVTVVDGGHPAGCWEFVRINWSQGAISDCSLGLLRFDIERSTDGGVTWKRMAAPTNIAVEEFDDYEAPRNKESSYRMRARRQDGAFSVWTTPIAVTPQMTCCGFLLTTNESPDRSLWFTDVGQRSWTHGPTPELQRYFGRHHGVAWGSLEEDGDAFTLNLLVGAEGGLVGTQPVPTADVGRQAFQDLLILASAEVDPTTGAKFTPSYVAVCDEKGNVWYASLSVTDTTYDALSGDTHTARVLVREVTDEPSKPEVSL